jgi:polyhydroxyalkanoate synthase
VDLDEIDMPVLQIVGEYDHLVPPESSRPFNDLVASDDTEIIEFPTGHIGLSVGSRSHAELWPRVAEWFAERSENPDRDLERISGVGAAYAARLRATGIESLTALAASDPDAVAAETDLAPGRVRDWVEQARTMVEGGTAGAAGDDGDEDGDGASTSS